MRPEGAVPCDSDPWYLRVRWGRGVGGRGGRGDGGAESHPSPWLSSQVLLPCGSPFLCVVPPLQQPFLVSFYLIPPAFLVMVPDCLSCLITDVH